MLYMLGALTIDTKPFNADAVRRRASADLPTKQVIGGLAPSEFTGEGQNFITLSGQLLPSKIGGLPQLEIAHGYRREGKRNPLQRGDGERLGWFAITNISERHRHLDRNGVGFVVRHRITLKEVQPDNGSGEQVITDILSLFRDAGLPV